MHAPTSFSHPHLFTHARPYVLLPSALILQAVIVALPPHRAGRIIFSPPMSATREQMFQRVFMGSVIK